MPAAFLLSSPDPRLPWPINATSFALKMTREFKERFTLPLAALDLNSAAEMIKVRPIRDKTKA